MPGPSSPRHVFFFDIDNCLYSPDLGITRLTKDRIHAFGQSIGISPATVADTCSTYLRDYGLTVRGLMQHHAVDPREFNNHVDASLPLESLIKPDPALRKMLLAVTARRWAFTNAGEQHARRVLRCLAVDDLFEGITCCDYSEPDFPCKPERRAYERAMQEAAIEHPHMCFFVDDSSANVQAAARLGWTAVEVSPVKTADLHITSIYDLPSVLPQAFAQPLTNP